MAFNTKQTKKAQVIIVFVLLIAVILLAASVLSGAFKGSGTGSASTQQAGSSASSGASSTDGSTGTSSGSSASGTGTGTSTGTSSSSSAAGSSSGSNQLTTMESVNAQYGQAQKTLQAQYDADPSNPDALLKLANGYFDWGVQAMNAAKTDDDKAHVTDLFNNAIKNYDAYLQKNPDSKSVQVDRAISIFYTGDHAKAIQTLEDFVKGDAKFGPAWANLGMFYENDGRKDDAKKAYENALEADPDNTYGVKTYAQQRLDNLNGKTTSSSSSSSN